MIKFFRKIRQKLLSEGNTGKYLKYAIGEILLVTIGILLALQVNNWNENRKLIHSVENLLLGFENELAHNIEESDYLISLGYYKDTLLTRYYHNEITPEEISGNSRMFLFPTATRQFYDENLNKLIELEKDLPDYYTQLISKLKELKRRIESQRKNEARIIELAWTRQNENAVQLPWIYMVYMRDSISQKKWVKHVLTDSIYKNKIMHYYSKDLYENTWDASLIKTASIAILWDIKKLRETEEVSIEMFLKNMDLIPLQELECDGYPFKEMQTISFRQSFVFYNNTVKTIKYRYADLDGEPVSSSEGSIPPKSFAFEEIRLPTNSLLEVFVNNSCKNLYRGTKKNYLIVN